MNPWFVVFGNWPNPQTSRFVVLKIWFRNINALEVKHSKDEDEKVLVTKVFYQGNIDWVIPTSYSMKNMQHEYSRRV